MISFSKSATVQSALDDWRDRGLIDDGTHDALSQDAQTKSSAFSFANILVLFAVICLGFAAMTFVAANWEDMSRPLRVGIIFGAMLAAWIVAVVLMHTGRNWFAQVFVLGACAMHGAGIMLISQLYHIQGEATDAIWLWAGITMIAAAATRSIPALCLTIILWNIWFFMGLDSWWRGPVLNYGMLLALGLCSAIALWQRSRFAAHLIALSLASWVVTSTAINFSQDQIWFAELATTAVLLLISIVLYSEGEPRWLRGFERAALFYALPTLGALVFALTLYAVYEQVIDPPNIPIWVTQGGSAVAVLLCLGTAAIGQLRGNDNTYDLWVTPAIGAALMLSVLLIWTTDMFDDTPILPMAALLALSIWTIRMGWRLEYRPIAVAGFIGFGLVMLWVYFETVGTLLGTSAFYLVVGVLLLLGVIVIPRLTRSAGGAS